jgi:hypothetical protein
MTLTPHSLAVLVVLGALTLVMLCSRIPVVGPFILMAVLVGVAAGVAGTALVHGLV